MGSLFCFNIIHNINWHEWLHCIVKSQPLQKTGRCAGLKSRYSRNDGIHVIVVIVTSHHKRKCVKCNNSISSSDTVLGELEIITPQVTMATSAKHCEPHDSLTLWHWQYHSTTVTGVTVTMTLTQWHCYSTSTTGVNITMAMSQLDCHSVTGQWHLTIVLKEWHRNWHCLYSSMTERHRLYSIDTPYRSLTRWHWLLFSLTQWHWQSSLTQWHWIQSSLTQWHWLHPSLTKWHWLQSSLTQCTGYSLEHNSPASILGGWRHHLRTRLR